MKKNIGTINDYKFDLVLVQTEIQIEKYLAKVRLWNFLRIFNTSIF